MADDGILLNADELRALCLEEGADDAGFVEADREALGREREEMRVVLPGVRSIIAICGRLNPESMRAPPRHYANDETRRVVENLAYVARRILARLKALGVRGLVPPVSFPMDTSRWPGKMWEVSHKPIAVQAGLGHMGVHRNVIHPTFGNFILLESILVDAAIDRYSRPLDVNPCTKCMLCVMVCPVGAISPTEPFDVNACLTHNYREFLGGFQDWVDELADSTSAAEYRRKVKETETLSWWQSLAHGPNYKSSYCMAVCPAGEENIGPFRQAPREYRDRVVQPLRDRREPVYVVPGSPAEAAVQRHPKKTVRRVRAPRHLRQESGRQILLRFSRLRAPEIRGRPFALNLELSGPEPLDVHLNVSAERVGVAYVFDPGTRAVLRADSEAFRAAFACSRKRDFLRTAARAWRDGRLRYRGPLRVLPAFLRIALRCLAAAPGPAPGGPDQITG